MKLTVKYKGIKAGVLWRDSGTYFFQYDEEFLVNPSVYAISVNLPKRKEVYKSEQLFPYFQSILPEGYNRELQAKALGLNVEDDWNLLANTCSHDTIGAITIEQTEEHG